MSALKLARAAVDAHNAQHGSGGIAAVARTVGISRTGLSLFLDGKYPAKSPAAVEGKILAALAGRVACPHLGRDIAAADCAGHAARPMPMSNPAALRHWQACRECRHRTEGADHAE